MKRYTIGLITLLLIVGCGKNGLHTYWHENGQKKIEGTYKDGKGNGVKTWWDKNGQKENVITFKDGEIILIGKDRIAVDYN